MYNSYSLVGGFFPLMVWYSAMTCGPATAEWRGVGWSKGWPTDRSDQSYNEPGLPYLWFFQANKPIKLLYSLHNINFLIITKPCKKNQCGRNPLKLDTPMCYPDSMRYWCLHISETQIFPWVMGIIIVYCGYHKN